MSWSDATSWVWDGVIWFVASLWSAGSWLISWIEGHDGLVTAVSTIVIACFTVTLSRSTRKLWNEAKRSGDIATIAANAAKESADFAAKAFLSSNRPRVRVKHLRLTYKEENGPDFPPGEGPSYPTGIELILVNVGTTPATLQEIKVQVAILGRNSRLPANPRSLGQARGLNKVLQSGAVVVVTDVVPGGTPFKNQQERDAVFASGACNLFCYGDVLYTDSIGGIMKTAFCRKLQVPIEPSREEGRFVVESDPDYEYED